VSRLLVAVAACLMIAGMQAEHTGIRGFSSGSSDVDADFGCYGSNPWVLNASTTYTLINGCANGDATLYITIADDVNQAFNLQVTDGVDGVNRTGVTLNIDQIVNADNTKNKYLSCKDADKACGAIFKPNSITTYTYRTLTLNWVVNNVKSINSTLVIQTFTTNAVNEVAVNSDKPMMIMPKSYENTRQIWKLTTNTDTNDNSYVSKFNVLPTNGTEDPCFLDDDTATFTLFGPTFINYKCNMNDETKFTGLAYLEYKRTMAKFDKPTLTGQTMYVATKKTHNSATRSAFSWAAALLVVYQIMLKY